MVGNEPIGALAHLGLGRAYALEGDTTRARAAYDDFFAFSKDADLDIPILAQAKAEYARLQTQLQQLCGPARFIVRIQIGWLPDGRRERREAFY
jgi:hypothetical protein